MDGMPELLDDSSDEDSEDEQHTATCVDYEDWMEAREDDTEEDALERDDVDAERDEHGRPLWMNEADEVDHETEHSPPFSDQVYEQRTRQQQIRVPWNGNIFNTSDPYFTRTAGPLLAPCGPGRMGEPVIVSTTYLDGDVHSYDELGHPVPCRTTTSRTIFMDKATGIDYILEKQTVRSDDSLCSRRARFNTTTRVL